MQNYLPTLKQMQYLVALHDHGHFGRAADACNVTQSTLSAGIRELEILLGQTLVERTRRVVRFTVLGDKIVAKAHRVLREAAQYAEARQTRQRRYQRQREYDVLEGPVDGYYDGPYYRDDGYYNRRGGVVIIPGY